jgi:hypothetical protein
VAPKTARRDLDMIVLLAVIDTDGDKADNKFVEARLANMYCNEAEML